MNRRRFLRNAAKTLGALTVTMSGTRAGNRAAGSESSPVTLFLCGDVMTGRGIDQILPNPGHPMLFEPYVKDARRYVELAQERHGPIQSPVLPSYIWGEALAELDRRQPTARIINLETAVTRSDDYWQDKGINYRMHPANIGCLAAAKINCCVLANNHVLDWGYDGLTETITTLNRARIHSAGAGSDLKQASKPAILELPGRGRVIVLAFGLQSSGIPVEWAAGEDTPGLNLLSDLSDESVGRIAAQTASLKRPGDLVLASIHWGSNWGYSIPTSHRRFARGLIDRAGVDLIHGHSSHHPRGIEVYRDRPILYGCGDFVTDYEGIGGHQQYRGDLVLGYWLSLDPVSGSLRRLEMTPFQSRRFRLETPSSEDVTWMTTTLDRESRTLGSGVERREDGALELRW